jgi:hypothetical protein
LTGRLVSFAPLLQVQHFGDRLSAQAGGAVAAGWAILALGRRWRPERSWIDRLGAALGAYWILFGTIAWLASGVPDLVRFFHLIRM